MNTEQIRELFPNDIDQVADLHRQSGIGDAPRELTRLCDYYKTTFLDSPWHNPALSSLVCCDANGQITGFIGVLSRQMSYNKTPLNVAVAHRFMVNPQQASPLAAIRLMKQFLSGPQDLSISDGANDQGKQFWLGSGGQISWLYSMEWFKPLCPASYFLTIASRKKQSWFRFFLPLCRLMDSVGYCPQRKTPISDGRIEEEILIPEKLLGCIQKFAAAKQLAPIYTIEEFQWLYRFMEQNTMRGKLEGCLLKDACSKIIGCFLYYLKKEGIAEVMLLCADKNKESDVYHCLLNHLRSKKAIGLIGRMVPDFIPAFGKDKVFFKRGSWAMIHSRRPELLESIHSGKVFLSSLEGELCLYAPSHII